MTQYGFYFDSTRCTGCRTCEMACKDYNDLSQTIAFRRIFDYEGGETKADKNGAVTSTTFVYHVSAACNHCADPACVAACPQQSMVKDEETGLVTNDPETCIGCGACANACPYEVPVVDEEAALSVKCDGCADRVAAGQQPICVDACPLRALEFGELDALAEAHPDAVNGIAPLADPAATNPSLLVLACPAAKEVGDETGFISNEKEVTGVEANPVGNGNPLA